LSGADWRVHHGVLILFPHGFGAFFHQTFHPQVDAFLQHFESVQGVIRAQMSDGDASSLTQFGVEEAFAIFGSAFVN
jgi:hypothetical protein